MAAVSAELDDAIAAAERDDGASWWARTEAGEWYPSRILGFNQKSRRCEHCCTPDRFRRWHLHRRRFVQRDPDVGDSAEGLLKKVGVVEGISDVSWHKDCSMGGHSRDCCGLTVGSRSQAPSAERRAGVVAGSHRANVSPARHRPGLDLPRVPLPTHTGDVTVHCSCTLHMSRPPVSAERRVVYTGFGLAPRAGDHRPRPFPPRSGADAPPSATRSGGNSTTKRSARAPRATSCRSREVLDRLHPAAGEPAFVSPQVSSASGPSPRRRTPASHGAASLRAMPPSAFDPSRSISPTKWVGPLARLANASERLRRAWRPPESVCRRRRWTGSPLGQQPAQRGRVGEAEHQREHVHALLVELGPQGFTHDQIEGLRGAVGHHPAGPDQSGSRGDQDDPPVPTLDHARGEVMAQLQGNEAVALHHGLGGGDGRSKNGTKLGSAPAQ